MQMIDMKQKLISFAFGKIGDVNIDVRLVLVTENSIYFNAHHRYLVSFKLRRNGKIREHCDCDSIGKRKKECDHIKLAKQSSAYDTFSSLVSNDLRKSD